MYAVRRRAHRELRRVLFSLHLIAFPYLLRRPVPPIHPLTSSCGFHHNPRPQLKSESAYVYDAGRKQIDQTHPGDETAAVYLPEMTGEKKNKKEIVPSPETELVLVLVDSFGSFGLTVPLK